MAKALVTKFPIFQVYEDNKKCWMEIEFVILDSIAEKVSYSRSDVYINLSGTLAQLEAAIVSLVVSKAQKMGYTLANSDVLIPTYKAGS